MLVRTILLIVLPLLVLSAITPLNLTLLCQQELARHNAYRAKYKYPPLTLNTTLVRIAQNFSKHLQTQLSSTQPIILFPSATGGNYGENLYWTWGYPSLTYVGGKASDRSYSESVNYVQWTNTYGNYIGHFTTMIWKSVKTVGFGFYQGSHKYKGKKNGQLIFVVANYYPTPNVRGQQRANLPQNA